MPFIFAGLGLIVAGHILEGAEKESFFTKLPDIVTLVPTLLGLKGNLEMTLGSRLSTLVGERKDSDKNLATVVSIRLRLDKSRGLKCSANNSRSEDHKKRSQFTLLSGPPRGNGHLQQGPISRPQ